MGLPDTLIVRHIFGFECIKIPLSEFGHFVKFLVFSELKSAETELGCAIEAAATELCSNLEKLASFLSKMDVFRR